MKKKHKNMRYLFITIVAITAIILLVLFLSLPGGQPLTSVKQELVSTGGFLQKRTVAFTPDVAVIGGGLAGMVAAISILDRGGSVLLVEKQPYLGGNSAKASSGINKINYDLNDDFDLFVNDTRASAGGAGVDGLASILVDQSNAAVDWLSKRLDLPLTKVSQLGGHSRARTFRPELGIVGAELTASLGKTLRDYSSRIRIVFDARLTGINLKDGRVDSIEWNGVATQSVNQVILASGGFGYDQHDMMTKIRPDLIAFPTTLGSQTTGDGIKIAKKIGAKLFGMEHVQLHPTGFVDPKDPEAHTKVLCAEMIRGIGGLLINPNNGSRFVNELGTRAYVTSKMLEVAQQAGLESMHFWILLPKRSVTEANAEKHVQHYVNSGLLEEMNSNQVISRVGKNLASSLAEYSLCILGKQSDEFGKVVFYGNAEWYDISKNEAWFLGKVTPVIHYTMGGVAIDGQARVLREDDGGVISGLYAIGEVAGGVHGKNRLGGNSLLECTVFGRLVGMNIPIANPSTQVEITRDAESKELLDFHSIFEVGELASKHDEKLIILYGYVYNLTGWKHPGGSRPINKAIGMDATMMFEAVHSGKMLDDSGFKPIGRIVDKLFEFNSVTEVNSHGLKHGKRLVVLYNNVYDLTGWKHPGGERVIKRAIGRDATSMFEHVHSQKMLDDSGLKPIGRVVVNREL